VNRVSHLSSLSAFFVMAASASLIFFASPPSAEAQIMYQTRPYMSPPSPTSTMDAIPLYDQLGTGTGYGCMLIDQVNGASNHTVFNGPDMNIAYHVSALFVVPAGKQGSWSFRWAPDLEYGGTVLIDGVELVSAWRALWAVGGSFTDPNQVLQGTLNLTAGTHLIELFGFELGDDDVTNAQFQAPGSAAFQDISMANLQLVPEVCAPNLLLMGASAAPSATFAGGQVAYTISYESIGSGPATVTTVVDALPANTTFVSASTGGVYDATTGSVTWPLGSVQPGVSGTVTVTVHVASPLAQGTVLTNKATLGASNATSSSVMTSVTVNAAPAGDAGATGGTGGSAATDAGATGGTGGTALANGGPGGSVAATGGTGGSAATDAAAAGGTGGTSEPVEAGAGGDISAGGAIGSELGGAGGAAGSVAAGGKGGASGQGGAAGSGSKKSSGCSCDIGATPHPGSFLWLVPMLAIALRRRGRGRRD
jgi:uncharacterized repeat protein (TIGR01451 family)